MQRYIISSILLGFICAQMAHGGQAKPPKSRGQNVDDPPLKLVSGKLTVKDGKTFDDKVRTLSPLVYDRKFPEQGFVLTTEEKKSK